MKHGTTPDCGEACDRVLAAKNGEDRHRFIELVAAYKLEDRIHGSGATARQKAWAEVYSGKFNARTATMRLGKYIEKAAKKASRDASAAAVESYNCHRKPASKAIREAVDAAEVDLLDIVKGIGRTDIGEFFYSEEETGGQDAALTKLLKWIVQGVARHDAPALEHYDLFGLGVFQSYISGWAPPSRKQLEQQMRRCGASPIRSMSELRELGLSKYLSGYKVNRYGVEFLIDFKEMRKLEAAMTNRLSSTLSIQDGDAAIAEVELANIKILRLRFPDEADSCSTAVAWELGAPMRLNPGDPETTKRDGDVLAWRDGRWVVTEVSEPLRLVG